MPPQNLTGEAAVWPPFFQQLYRRVYCYDSAFSAHHARAVGARTDQKKESRSSRGGFPPFRLGAPFVLASQKPPRAPAASGQARGPLCITAPYIGKFTARVFRA